MSGPYRALAGPSPAETERQVSLRIDALIDARTRARTRAERRRRARRRLERLAYVAWIPATSALAWGLYLGDWERAAGWTAMVGLVAWLTVTGCARGPAGRAAHGE